MVKAQLICGNLPSGRIINAALHEILAGGTNSIPSKRLLQFKIGFPVEARRRENLTAFTPFQPSAACGSQL